jgi:hypothetical protein
MAFNILIPFIKSKVLIWAYMGLIEGNMPTWYINISKSNTELVVEGVTNVTFNANPALPLGKKETLL